MKKLLFILGALIISLPSLLNGAAGRDQQVISPVQACANGNITGGSVIICVQSTIITQSGCIGASCKAGGEDDGIFGPEALVVQDGKESDAPVQFATKNIPTVNLGRITRDTPFKFYLPAPGSQMLYTFIPTAGVVAADKHIEVLLAMEKSHRPEYVQAKKETAFDPDAYDLRLYKREKTGWKSIGLLTQVLEDFAQPDAQPPVLTVKRDGSIVIPVQDKQPMVFNVARL